MRVWLCEQHDSATAGHGLATPSPADSLVAAGDSLIPRTRSRARFAAREARATAEGSVSTMGGETAQLRVRTSLVGALSAAGPI